MSLKKKVLVTAGPTYEAIDPVRFIGNHSSGKMGYAIAESFARRGAEVVLVSGPTSLAAPGKGVKLVNVVSASEMYEACYSVIRNSNIAVFAAAVSDFQPAKRAPGKIKEKGAISLELVPTKDIAGELGKIKKGGQFFVGFALETEEGIPNAKAKLERKNLDMIVLNSLEDQGAGFATDTNRITMIDKSGNIDTFELKLKTEVAEDIVERTLKLMNDA